MPLALWWLNAATVHADGLAVIAFVHIGARRGVSVG